jgi:hypothetical protein
MKIKKGSTYIAGLAGDPQKSQASNLSVNGVRLEQLVEKIRADFIGLLDRKNVRHTITWEVTRIHANMQTSEAFVLDHPGAVMGPDTFTFEFSTGSRVTTGFLNAVTCKQTGLTTRHSYTLICGAITTP